MEDLPLYEQLLTDPAMMAELGGPRPREGLREKLQGIVSEVVDGETWYSVIVPGRDAGEAAGTVCVWHHQQDGEPINEIGWMVPGSGPGHRGRSVDLGAGRCRGAVGPYPRVPRSHERSLQRGLPEDGIRAARPARRGVRGASTPLQPLAARGSHRSQPVELASTRPRDGDTERFRAAFQFWAWWCR